MCGGMGHDLDKEFEDIKKVGYAPKGHDLDKEFEDIKKVGKHGDSVEKME